MTPPKKTYGLIGDPVKHSLSPLMQEAAFKEAGILAEYKLFEVKSDGLEDFLLNRCDVIGFNVTIPYKVRAKKIIDEKFPKSNEVDLFSSFIGAINTVKREGKDLKYCNTDAKGFLRALDEDLKFNAQGKTALVIGCGGAGRAVVAALSTATTDKVFIYEKDYDVIRSAQKQFEKVSFLGKWEFISADKIIEVIPQCDLLVNATSLGMKEGDGLPIDKNLLERSLFVYDLVYNRNTELVKEARAKGLAACNGLGMLLYQGAAAFEFWTGKTAPIDAMRDALKC